MIFFLKFNISYRVSGALSILLINVMLFCFVFYFGNEFIEILKKIYNNHAESFIILKKYQAAFWYKYLKKILQRTLKNINKQYINSRC